MRPFGEEYSPIIKSFTIDQINNFEKVRERLNMKRLSLYWDDYPLLSEEQIKYDDLTPTVLIWNLVSK